MAKPSGIDHLGLVLKALTFFEKHKWDIEQAEPTTLEDNISKILKTFAEEKELDRCLVKVLKGFYELLKDGERNYLKPFRQKPNGGKRRGKLPLVYEFNYFSDSLELEAHLKNYGINEGVTKWPKVLSVWVPRRETSTLEKKEIEYWNKTNIPFQKEMTLSKQNFFLRSVVYSNQNKEYSSLGYLSEASKWCLLCRGQRKFTDSYEQCVEMLAKNQMPVFLFYVELKFL